MSKWNDPDVINTLIDAFGKGATIEMACGCAGIDRSAYTKWQQKAEKGDKRYITIFTAIKKAKHKGNLRCLEEIDAAIFRGVWQAAAWKLERIHPEDYGNNAGVRELNVKMDKLLKDKEDEAKKEDEGKES